MKIRNLALVLGVALLGSPAAFAQCPDSRLQDAVDRFNKTERADAALRNQLAGEAIALIGPCAADPHVMRVTALTLGNLANAETDAKQLDWADASMRAWFAMLDALPQYLSDLPAGRTVTLPSGQVIEMKIDGINDTSKNLLNTLLFAEQRAQRTAPVSQPAEPGVSYFRTCGFHHNAMALAARTITSSDKNNPTPWNLLDRIAQSCRGDMGHGARDTLEQRVNAIMHWVRMNADAPADLRLARVMKAARDSHEILSAYPRGNAFWHRDSEDAMILWMVRAASDANAGHLVPKADWFRPDQINHPAIVTSIAMDLDAAWAEDMKVGVSGAYVNYRKVISDAYAEINKLEGAENESARWMLHRVARLHAAGTARRPENAALQEPPGFLWSWIRPGGTP